MREVKFGNVCLVFLLKAMGFLVLGHLRFIRICLHDSE